MPSKSCRTPRGEHENPWDIATINNLFKHESIEVSMHKSFFFIANSISCQIDLRKINARKTWTLDSSTILQNEQILKPFIFNIYRCSLVKTRLDNKIHRCCFCGEKLPSKCSSNTISQVRFHLELSIYKSLNKILPQN